VGLWLTGFLLAGGQPQERDAHGSRIWERADQDGGMGGGPQVLSRDSIREASPRLAWTRGPGRRVYLVSSL
jgi:hypothetical protein